VFVRAPVMARAEGPLPQPLAVTFGRLRDFKSFFSMERVDTDAPDISWPKGELEVLFCRACGKVDWFVKNPADVPIGETYGTELVEAGTNAPYR
jgi:hypothetical protein